MMPRALILQAFLPRSFISPPAFAVIDHNAQVVRLRYDNPERWIRRGWPYITVYSSVRAANTANA
jgi:hypothetical protein